MESTWLWVGRSPYPGAVDQFQGPGLQVSGDAKVRFITSMFSITETDGVCQV